MNGIAPEVVPLGAFRLSEGGGGGASNNPLPQLAPSVPSVPVQVLVPVGRRTQNRPNHASPHGRTSPSTVCTIDIIREIQC